jgi:hypothetical protein
MYPLHVLNRLLRQQLLDLLLRLEAPERRPDDTVEEEGEVHEEGEADDLEPLERLPAEAEGDHPDEEGAARVDGRAGGCADAAGDGESEEVEASVGG